MAKRILCVLLTVLGLLLMTDGSLGTEYVLQGSYYFDGTGIAYTRSSTLKWYWVNPTYYCGRCTASGYWQGFYEHTYTPVVLTPKTDRQVVLGIMADRAAFQNKMAKSAQEQAEVIELIREAGLSQNFTYGGYFGGRLNVPVNAYLTGTTVYAPPAQYQTLQIDAKGVDVNLLAQQLARGMDGTIDLAGKVYAGYAGFAANADNNNSRVRELLARGAVASSLQGGAGSLFRSTEPAGELSIKRFGPAPAGPIAEPPQLAVGANFYLKLGGVQKCVKCHVEKQDGGFNMSLFDPATAKPEELGRVAKYINRKDGKGCPKNGVTLSPEEVTQILTGN